MTRNKNLLLKFRKYDTKQYVKVVNNERMKIIGDGSIRIRDNNFKCVAC
jgi:hypothetical protein